MNNEHAPLIHISEIFYSLQGEGLLAGMPSVFIRLAGCPLRCTWCDTKYAWSPASGRPMTTEQIAEEAAARHARHIVLTGGEPMACPDLAALAAAMVSPQRHITIETAGIIFIRDLPCDLMSISPKLASSGAAEDESKRLDFDVLKKLIAEYEYQLKFVVDRPEDMDEIARCLEKLPSADADRVMLMPQAVRREDYIQKSQWLAEICLKSGFRFSPRLQVLLLEQQARRVTAAII